MVWKFGRIVSFWKGWSFLPSDSIPFWRDSQAIYTHQDIVKRPLEPPNHVFSNPPPDISTCPPPKKKTKHSFHQKQKRCKLRSIAISFVTPWGAPAVSHYEDLQLSLNVNQRKNQKNSDPGFAARFSQPPKKIMRFVQGWNVLAYINSWNIFWAWWFVFIFKFSTCHLPEVAQKRLQALSPSVSITADFNF